MAALALAPITVRAQGDAQDLSRNPKTRYEARLTRWYASLQFGAGYLESNTAGQPGLGGTKLAWALGGGLNVTPQWRLGLEYGGQMVHGVTNSYGQSYTVDTSGTGLTRTFAVAQWYPSTTSGWFLRGGGGLADLSDRRVQAPSAHGTGYTAGIGWDGPPASAVAFTVQLAYSWGTLPDAVAGAVTTTGRSFNAPELRVGIAWH